MTGLETAEILCRDGNKVTVVEMAKDVAPGNWFQLTDDELERLTPYGVEFLTGRKLTSIAPGWVSVRNVATEQDEIIHGRAG